MSTINYKYSEDVDILLIELLSEPIDHGEDYGQMIVHLSAQDQPVALEIFDARDFVGDILGTMLDVLTHSSVLSVRELARDSDLRRVSEKFIDCLKAVTRDAQNAHRKRQK